MGYTMNIFPNLKRTITVGFIAKTIIFHVPNAAMANKVKTVCLYVNCQCGDEPKVILKLHLLLVKVQGTN